tara:strand:- start:24921 stop:25490 length:570 start_codon:yes stop_codon:yes gene_type:complete
LACSPQAIQIADRWHLLKNARETSQKVIDRHQMQVRENDKLVAEHESQLSPLNPTILCNPVVPLQNSTLTISVAIKSERCMNRFDLHQSGMTSRKIASQLRVGRRTVRRYLRADFFPEWAKRSGTSCLDPYLAELKSMWGAGVTRATVLWKQLKEMGFEGSYSVMSRKDARLRKNLETSGDGKRILHHA